MNIPNILTVSRIVLILIFVVLAANAGEPDETPTHAESVIRWIAYSLAIIAAVTDLLDGYLARKWNQVTDFGKLMDPLADKILVMSAMLMAVEFQLMPAWIAVAVLTREFMVTGLRSLAAQKNIVIAADGWGKIKTVLQMLMLALAGAAWVGLFDLARHGWQWYVWNGFLIGIVAVTVFSGCAYFYRYRHIYIKSL